MIDSRNFLRYALVLSSVARPARPALLLLLLFSAAYALAQEPAVHPLVRLAAPETPRLEFVETTSLDFKNAASFGNLLDGWRTDRCDIYIYEAREERWGLGCPSLVASVVVHVHTPRDLVLHLHMWPHVDAMLPDQQVGVVWNNARLGTCAFTKETGWQTRDFVFDVPRDAIVSGDNVITFTARHCVSPRQIGRGTDSRPFSFGLASLELATKPAEGQDAAAPVPSPPFQLDGDGLIQPANSRVVFPVQLPETVPAFLSLQATPSEPGVKGRVTARWDTVTGPEERLIFETAPGGEARGAEGIELSGLAGQIVEAVLDVTSESGAGTIRWGNPLLFTHNPPPAPVEPPPVLPELPRVDHVVLIILDALRADRLGCMGALRSTSPFIDALAARGVRFTRAYSPAPYTFSSTYSLLTGLYQFQHQAPQTPKRPADALPRLPAVLREHEIVTGCVSANTYISPETGMTTGFDEFMTAYETLASVRQAGNRHELEGDPALATRQAREFIQRHAAERTFLYIHYRQPHAPYFAPGDYGQSLTVDPVESLLPEIGVQRAVNEKRRAVKTLELQQLQARYEENLLAVDAEVGRIWNTIEELGLADKTAFIVTADHGEAFLEHGQLGHSNTVYNEETHIPLIFVAPGLTDLVAPVQEHLVNTVDFFPTVCALLGATIPAGLSGRSILAPRPTASAGEIQVMAQNDQDLTPSEAYWFARYKLLLNRFRHGLEIYDLTADPEEKRDLAIAYPVLANYLRANAEAWKNVHRLDPALSAVVGEDLGKDLEEQLEALGYVQ